MRAISSVFGMIWNYLEGVRVYGLLEAHYCAEPEKINLCPASIKLLPLPPVNQIASDWESSEHYSCGLAPR